MAFDLQSGYGLGAGADELRQQLQDLFAQAVTKQKMQQDAKRLSIDQQRADDERAYRLIAAQSQAQDHNERAAGAQRALNLKTVSQLPIGAVMGEDTDAAAQGAGLGDRVERTDAVPTRNLSGIAQTGGTAPTVGPLTATTNAGLKPLRIWTGTAEQIQAAEDRKAKQAELDAARQEREGARQQASQDKIAAQAQSAADREALARLTAGLRGGTNDLQRQILQDKVEAAAQKRTEAQTSKDTARNAALSSIDDTASALDELIDAQGNLKPGVGGAVGLDALRSRIPGTAAADAKARIDRLQSRLTVDLLGEMKRQSRTGASGFGALSEKELAVLQNAAARLGTNQSDESFRQSLMDVRKQLAGMRQRASGGAVPAQGGAAPAATETPEQRIQRLLGGG